MKKLILLLLLGIFGLGSSAHAQAHEDSVKSELNNLCDDYIGRIKRFGFTPSLPVPVIVLDNPRSFGNYDRDANILHTCDWTTLPAAGKAFFDGFAQKMGHGMTGEKFFRLVVYQWIFVHELSHWWRACQHQHAEPYEEEKAANRIDAAYWKEKDPAFYRFMLSVFNGVVGHMPSPVPAGQSKEKYLNENYQKLPGGDAYSWYQSIMIVEVSKEQPFETFKQAIAMAGKPLKY